MLNEKMIEKLEAKGFNRWAKGNFDRLYFNAEELLEVEYYNSGNVNNAWLDGEKISNARARRILSTKAFIDVATGKISISCSDEDFSEMIEKKINAIISEVESEAEETEGAEETEEVEEVKEEAKLEEPTEKEAENTKEENEEEKRICKVNLNFNEGTDKKIVEKLMAVENVEKYIKQLITKDIKNKS